MKNEFKLVVLSVALAAIVIGCGSSSFKTGTPFQTGETRFFDDGIDMIEDMSKLAGQWGFKQEEEFDGRVQLSDLIAKINVTAIQTFVDLEGNEVKRIDVKVLDILSGKSPYDVISLLSPKNSPGHPLIERYSRHITGQLLLFVRWFDKEDGTIGHHFHLSPATPQMLAELKKRMAENQQKLEKLQK